ncbi:hypothetical protein [Nocardia arthritidis]|nr:hypothetical protein [Nocardia arthritidis]
MVRYYRTVDDKRFDRAISVFECRAARTEEGWRLTELAVRTL